MPKISFAKPGRAAFDAAPGTNLMQALLDHDVPVASSCHGDGVCAKCRIEVSQGLESLGARNETEEFLAERFSLKKNVRISCQVRLGDQDLTVDTTYW
ncbi:MAG: 2Fe-2S iron-sulfur cluster binding domain-containing protein [Bdellovibrionaceae bacterium]|nr:2Fe-2S iron-sulfur cluster binding domain-containing protein [Pseudobdellovibrionaceae bacterium]